MLTINEQASGTPVPIDQLRGRKLLCITNQLDYNFIAGNPYLVHYTESSGTHIFGTTKGFLFFHTVDQTNLKDLPQEVLNKFVVMPV